MDTNIIVNATMTEAGAGDPRSSPSQLPGRRIPCREGVEGILIAKNSDLSLAVSAELISRSVAIRRPMLATSRRHVRIAGIGGRSRVVAQPGGEDARDDE